ncbi:unnamed protein product [Clonostachys chloroleuca]|uniref:Cytochrome oxidase c assembly domain-containing protein n=1 Tax=Clonostachys chloroleuca TaxID=1926264 RepID=A0AA35VNV4_9HYPO|nr:unnamed protein product [Clonostachys chloroleuca]
MASRIASRSVKDATRFTSTIPHAASKSAQSSAASKAAAQSRIPGETPEQRVRRLRQAHLAAQRAQVSTADNVINYSRKFFDVAHKFTIGSVILFTAVAGVVSIYSVWDMLQYNRARRAEWIEAQKTLEADELSAARIAYIKGDATEEQILLVEEANRDAEKRGVKLPPLLAPPEHRTHFEEHLKPSIDGEKAPDKAQGKGILGVLSGLTGSKNATASESTQGGNSTQPTVLAATQTIEEKAKQAWETELDNQRKGGSLDQIGLDNGTSTQTPAKKGWWPW